MKCPVCDGEGVLPESYRHLRDEKEMKREMAKVLDEHGFSLRQIAKALGYKSHRSVVLALEDEK
jgi:division protein CdvB (Snf7/Vps24/ESCRT-III family)